VAVLNPDLSLDLNVDLNAALNINAIAKKMAIYDC
jgi:hypothetical protein